MTRSFHPPHAFAPHLHRLPRDLHHQRHPRRPLRPDVDLLRENPRQNPLPLPRHPRDGSDLGLRRHPIARPHGLLRFGRLHHPHVADICPHRGNRRRLAGQFRLPATPEEIQQGIASQIFGVVGASDLPTFWSFAHSLPLQLILVVALPRTLGADLRLARLPLSRDRRLPLDPHPSDDPRLRALPVPERLGLARQQRPFRPAEPARIGCRQPRQHQPVVLLALCRSPRCRLPHPTLFHLRQVRFRHPRHPR